jgi:hypothetical protein
MRFSYDREEDVLMIETAYGGTIDHAGTRGRSLRASIRTVNSWC